MDVPMGVSVRHNSRLAALVALAAGALAVAWFARALRSDSLVDWAWFVAVTMVGVVQLVVVRDSRAPLLVADEQGVRVRRGVTWTGLRWQDIENVEVSSPGPLLRDGRIVVHPRAVEDAPEQPTDLVVRLGLTTRRDVQGLTGNLVDDLDVLASGRVPVLVLTRAESKEATEDEVADDEAEETQEPEVVAEPADATKVQPLHDPKRTEREFEPVEPVREARPAARAEVISDSVRMLPSPPPIPAQRSGDAPVLVARVDDLEREAPQPADDAVIGPLVAAARHRARLSIDTLSERTRIRPHVLECIEVDDFVSCGGDFYARGHLRTLARVFGLDAQQLLDLYDEHYASAEIEARQVFEAELATGIGGGVRAIHSGPRWSLLAACVLALAMVWGAARVFNDTPQEVVSPAPGVVDSAGLAGSTEEQEPTLSLATLEVTAVGTSPQVAVRDRDGQILWAGKLVDGQRQQVLGLAPFDVTASNGAGVKVAFLGKARGTVGPSAEAASKTFGK